jgi:hypothetical protein
VLLVPGFESRQGMIFFRVLYTYLAVLLSKRTMHYNCVYLRKKFNECSYVCSENLKTVVRLGILVIASAPITEDHGFESSQGCKVLYCSAVVKAKY